MGTEANVAAWVATNEPFNRGDQGPFLDLLEPDVVWMTGAAVVEGRAAVEAFLDQLRAAGWSSHNVLTIAGQGPVVATTYVNRFEDGGEYAGGGVAMFNDAGRIVTMASLGEFPEGLVGD